MATSSIQLFFVGVILIILWTESGVSGDVPDDVVYTDLHKMVHKGDSVVLTCRFRGTPLAVYWKKGDDPKTAPNLVSWIPTDDVTGLCEGERPCQIMEMNENHSLVIKEVSIADQGRYICRVTVRGILIHNFTDISVFSPPMDPFPIINECQVVSPNNTETTCVISTSHSLKISCSASGYYPDIDLYFIHGSTSFHPKDTIEVTNLDGTRNKTISAIATASEISYICIASEIPGSQEQRTTTVLVNLPETPFPMPTGTTIPIKKTVGSKTKVVVPVILVIAILAAICPAIIIFWRRRKQRGNQGKISFYELWLLIFGKDNDDGLEKICDTIRHLGISDVEDRLNAIQCYDFFCYWKDNHKQDSQVMDLKRALAKAGFDKAWKEIQDERHRTDAQLSEVILNHILWQVRDLDSINQFLGDLIPGKKSVAGKMKDIVAEASGELIQWCKVPPQQNPMVLLSLSLEKASCCPIDRNFFTVPEGLLEEIGEYEVLGFTQRLESKHCKKLAESIGTPEEALNAILVENDKAPVFDTQGMILDWISKEECSNFEKRHRLNVAVTKVCRDDLKGHFGATHLYNSTEANAERAEKNSNEISREYGGISELEMRRIANYLSDSELKQLGEGSDPEKVVIEWVKRLLEKNPDGGCRKRVHETMKEFGLQVLMPFQLKDKACLVELLDVTTRLLMTDIQPFAKALGISDQKLIKYRIDVTPKQLSNGTLALLAKDSTKINIDRSKICSSLSKAGYKDLALLLKYGYAISLADMFALGYGPVPNSSQRDELRQSLGIAADHDDIVSMLKHWRSMVHPPTYNPRTALADAVLPVLGKEKALAVLSGKSRQNGIPSEKVIRALREEILFRETCRVAEIINAPLPSVDDDLVTQVLITLEDQVKNDLLPEDVYEKLSVAGFKGLSTEIKKGDRQEKENEEITRMRKRDIIQNDISCRIAEVLGVKKTSSLSSIFEAWEEKLRKNPLKQDKRRELSDRLLRAGYDDFAHEIMTGFVPRPVDQK